MAVWHQRNINFHNDLSKNTFLSPQVPHVIVARHVNATGQVSRTATTEVLWGMPMWEFLQTMKQSSHTPMLNCSISK